MKRKRIKKKIIYRHQLKSRIRNWVNRVARKLDDELIKNLYRFEDVKGGEFYFYYDGTLYDVLYTGEMNGFEFETLHDLSDEFGNLFYESGWDYDFEESSVIHCFKEVKGNRPIFEQIDISKGFEREA